MADNRSYSAHNVRVEVKELSEIDTSVYIRIEALRIARNVNKDRK